jgi:hypothetical protein
MDSNLDPDDSDQDLTVVEDKQLEFVQLLKKWPILLDKSQVPAVKEGKRKAADRMLIRLELDLAMTMNEKSLMKKINNMKTKIKEKIDKNKTGNKKIILCAWEKEFAVLIDVGGNPVFNKIPGKLIAIYIFDPKHFLNFFLPQVLHPLVLHKREQLKLQLINQIHLPLFRKK